MKMKFSKSFNSIEKEKKEKKKIFRQASFEMIKIKIT